MRALAGTLYSPFPDSAREHLRVEVGVVARPVPCEVSEPGERGGKKGDAMNRLKYVVFYEKNKKAQLHIKYTHSYIRLLRGTRVNRTYGIHKNLSI